ncbi:MAG: 6-phosphogluconolactonase [Hyphomicrobiaceae bacterium]
MSDVTRFDWPDAPTLRAQLAARIAGRLAQWIDKNGSAWLAVSGGRTPIGLFEALSAMDLDWGKVTITLVDERWVDENSPRSNAALVRTHLLKGRARAACFVPLFTPGMPIETGRDLAEVRLADLPSVLAVAILGMGDDGHTASWFPGGEQLSEALDPTQDRVVAIVRAAAADEPRLTLTRPALMRAGWIALHIEGEAKRIVLDFALGDGPVEEMPVRAVLRSGETPLEIHWAP